MKWRCEKIFQVFFSFFFFSSFFYYNKNGIIIHLHLDISAPGVSVRLNENNFYNYKKKKKRIIVM